MVLSQLMKEGCVIRARNLGYQEAPADEQV